MTSYAIKLTIAGLFGAFAEKYSCVVEDAQWLHTLVQEKGPRKQPIELLAARDEPAHFDPMPLFAPLMKLLRRAAHDDASRRFFTGARFEPTDGPPGPWLPTVAAVGTGGEWTVAAWGTKAVARAADGTAEELDLGGRDEPVLEVSGGLVRCRFGTWQELFKQPLEDLVHMCEEAMAKDQSLIATTLSER